MDVYENIRKSGYELPPSPPKGGIYKPVKQVGNLLFISGQGATRNGLSVLHEYLGDLNKIKSVVKILAFVASAPGFNSQPAVVDGASQLLKDVFGDDNGVGARSAISAIELPGNISVEIEFIFEI